MHKTCFNDLSTNESSNLTIRQIYFRMHKSKFQIINDSSIDVVLTNGTLGNIENYLKSRTYSLMSNVKKVSPFDSDCCVVHSFRFFCVKQ
jgi:hypothetical protein